MKYKKYKKHIKSQLADVSALLSYIIKNPGFIQGYNESDCYENFYNIAYNPDGFPFVYKEFDYDVVALIQQYEIDSIKKEKEPENEKI